MTMLQGGSLLVFFFRMKFFARRLLALGAPLLMAACATVGPPQPPSLELPKPPSDLRAVRKGDHVTLTWSIPTTTTDRQTLRSLEHTRICRALEVELTRCSTPVGEVVAKPSPGVAGKKVTGSYVDSLPEQTQNPSSFVTYAIEVLNTDGRGAGLSNQAPVSLARTLPPPRDFAAQVTGQGVLLSWTGDVPPADSAHYLYRVYRSAEAASQRTLAGELKVGPEQKLTLADASIEWEKTYEYRAEIVTVIAQENKPDLQIEGDDTAPVKVFIHDVFPPAVPAGLQAVFSGPGQQPFIDLIWAPVTDVDLDGYNVFRHEEGAAPVQVNAERLKTPAYRDVSVVSGKKYFYSVSAVDVRANESARSEEAIEAVP
jgi:hypothetical protein